MRALYLRMPAVATIVLVVGAGYLIGGVRSALVVCALTLFIALSPWWDRALVTHIWQLLESLYLVLLDLQSELYVFKINIQQILCWSVRYFSNFPVFCILNSCNDVIRYN